MSGEAEKLGADAIDASKFDDRTICGPTSLSFTAIVAMTMREANSWSLAALGGDISPQINPALTPCASVRPARNSRDRRVVKTPDM